MKYLIILILSCSQLGIFAQDVESEVGFIYVKAEYLLETQRYDEAIGEYNRVIDLQADYKEALLRRATAKYAMASYRGVRADIMNYIKMKGISPEAMEMLAKTDYKQGNHEAALNSLNTILSCAKEDAELYHIRGECYLALEDFEMACGSWTRASKMGYNKSTLQINKYCSEVASSKPNSGTRPRPGKTGKSDSSDGPVNKPIPGKTEKPTSPKPNMSDIEIGGDENGEVVELETIPEPEEPAQPFDDRVNTIIVDEDLTLIIKNGMGGRKVLQQPNILILSEQSGNVAINIEVNERGRVSAAKFDEGNSTLDTRSIVSLALRKAQEFWFEKSDWPSTNGTIVFKIGN